MTEAAVGSLMRGLKHSFSFTLMSQTAFWDRLYFGLGAEYLITGELFMAGYEAFKLPADFGLDLIVTSQKMLSLRGGEQVVKPQKPFTFQVKSRRIKEFEENVMGRPEATTYVSIKEDDWHLIVKDPNAHLVCVLIFREDPRKLQNRWTYFWLGSPHLKELLERRYVTVVEGERTGSAEYRLKVVLRLQSTIMLEDVLDDLVEGQNLTGAGKEKLLDTFAHALPPKWSTREYISLARPNRSRSGGPDVVRKIPDGLTTFSALGEDVDIRVLD